MTELERAERILLSCGFNLLEKDERSNVSKAYGLMNPTVIYDVATDRFRFVFSALTPKELGVDDNRPLTPSHLATRLDAFVEVVLELGGSRKDSAEIIDLYESRGWSRYGDDDRYQLADCVTLTQLPYSHLDKVMLVANKVPLSLIETFDPRVPLGFYAELNGFSLNQ